MFSEWGGPAVVAIGFSVLGFCGHILFVKLRDAAAQRSAQDILLHAKRDAEVILKEAQLSIRDETTRLREKTDAELAVHRKELSLSEERLAQREDWLERKNQHLQEREQWMDRRIEENEALRTESNREREQLEMLLQQAQKQLESVSGLTADAAKAELLHRLESELTAESASWIRKKREEAVETAERQAREIITESIQRYAADQTADVTTVTIQLPNEEMKGRIIGREGRNFRAIEMATGVNLIIDDTPGLIVLSSFDPVRREIAKITLERLMLDGRINPALIEEMVDKVTADLDNIMLKTAEDTVAQLGLKPVPLVILQHIGRLQFRQSFNQNVLQHSKETAFLAGMIAAELGLDEDLAKRIGLFHDIGKALDHDIAGSHAEIGANLLRQAGESALVVEAVAAHHGEGGATGNIYSSLVAAADAITASRPGARMELTQLYLKRMADLEVIAQRQPGVLRSFAMQAGRELRVFVEPTRMTDDASIELARAITQQIEKEVEYPGQIKVTVIRETRFVEYAR